MPVRQVWHVLAPDLKLAKLAAMEALCNRRFRLAFHKFPGDKPLDQFVFVCPGRENALDGWLRVNLLLAVPVNHQWAITATELQRYKRILMYVDGLVVQDRVDLIWETKFHDRFAV